MTKKWCLLFLILTLAGSARVDSRQSVPSKSNRVKTGKTRVISRSNSDAVESLFNIYDPSFLALVWPKITNGVHLFVDRDCWEDISVFFKDLSEGRAWAYRAVDASGRYEGGLLQGNRFWLGSKQECLQLDDAFLSREGNESYDEFQNGDYLNAVLRREKYYDDSSDDWRTLVQRDELMHRLVAAANAPPYRLSYTAVQIAFNLTKLTMAEAYDITLGVCLPRSCTLEDIATVINFSIMLNDNLKSNKTIPRNIKLTGLRQIDGYYDIKTDIGAIILICTTLLIIALAITATVVDLKLIKCIRHNSKSMSFDLQKFNNTEQERTNLSNLDEKNHKCDAFTRKESKVVDMETLTINNINNSNNINLVTVKKVMKPNSMPPSITLDVVSMDRVTGSCKRCGKYKKQCNANLRQTDNLPACPRVKSFASFTEHKREDKFFKSLLLCFSLKYSWKRIFNTNTANKDLSLIHGLKILATLWIIFVHTAVVANYISEDGGNINEFNNAYYILTTGTLAFDTMFFISGLISCHHFFFLKSQYTVEQLVSFGGTCGQVLQFVCFVINRAIRMVPSYAYVIFVTGVLSRASQHTSPLATPERDDLNCDLYWWRNLLYITTIFPRHEQCMQLSWYMSLESQLHMLGALLCACASCGSGRAVLVAMLVLLLGAAASDLFAAYYEFGLQQSSVFTAYSSFIERPVARVAPYFTGILAGWLVHRAADSAGGLALSKTKSSCLWILCTMAVVGALLVPWVARSWVCSWLHLTWPLALLWPVVAATDITASRRLLDSAVVAALSRLCYSMLLLHGATVRFTLLASDGALCGGTGCIWSYFAGTTLLTMVGALLLSLLVETPCCSLLRTLSGHAT